MKMEETIKLQSFFKILISMFSVNAGSEDFFVEVFYQACTNKYRGSMNGFSVENV